MAAKLWKGLSWGEGPYLLMGVSWGVQGEDTDACVRWKSQK